MYRYDEFDTAFVAGRVAQFSDQVNRRLLGELNEDQFRPLRLMNGLYLQLHAYMLRIAVPYGTLRSKQVRMLGHIARKYDRGYGHFTTRQNIQFNWPKLRDVPAILADLASVEMHAIQTSGNCIRNITTDQFAGAAADEIIDPRPVAEILRQWSSLHPEFSYLPRKFKIAMTGAPSDRAAIKFHDIGLKAARNAAGEIGWEVEPSRAQFLPNSVAYWMPFRESNAAMDRLGKRYEVGIVSNIDDKLLGISRRHLRTELDLVVTAQQVRSYKPDPVHFKEAARRIGGKKGWLHIGCNYTNDVAPLLKMNVPVIWVNRHGEKLEGRKAPSATVKTFRDAAKKLGAS